MSADPPATAGLPPATDRPAGAAASPPALALDAGGTQCRWALAAADGRLLAEGRVPGFGGAQAASARGRAGIAAAMAPLRDALAPFGAPRAVWGGITGLDDAHGPALAEALAPALGVPPAAVALSNDLVMACRALWAPGEGYVLVAGTGAIAGFVDAQGRWHRVGGRGVVIDDGGGGHWIAVQALRRVWRAEDAEPGAWRRSLLAQRLFDLIGGSEWADTRRFLVQADRGRVGRLALAVGEVAEADPAALQILQAAGRELARLAQVLRARFGPGPLAQVGRVWALHPAVQAAFQAELPAGITPQPLTDPVAVQAARRAAAGEPLWPPAPGPAGAPAAAAAAALPTATAPATLSPPTCPG